MRAVETYAVLFTCYEKSKDKKRVWHLQKLTKLLRTIS